MFLPIRPNPLIPTLMAIRVSSCSWRAKTPEARTAEKPEGWTDVMLGGAASSLRRAGFDRGLSQLLQTSQPVVDGGLRKLHAPGQLSQIQLWVRSAPASHLA